MAAVSFAVQCLNDLTAWSSCLVTHVYVLTHLGRVTHICVNKLTIIGSDNGLPSDRRQAIIWTNAGILLIGPLGTNFSGILIQILKFSFKKMRLKVSSAKWRPFCLGLNVLRPELINALVLQWTLSQFYANAIPTTSIFTMRSVGLICSDFIFDVCAPRVHVLSNLSYYDLNGSEGNEQG